MRVLGFVACVALCSASKNIGEGSILTQKLKSLHDEALKHGLAVRVPDVTTEDAVHASLATLASAMPSFVTKSGLTPTGDDSDEDLIADSAPSSAIAAEAEAYKGRRAADPRAAHQKNIETAAKLDTLALGLDKLLNDIVSANAGVKDLFSTDRRMKAMHIH